MKAAVVHQLGTIPSVEEFQDAQIQNDSEVLVRVLASSLKNLDKLRVSGAHYNSHAQLPVVAGIDGVGQLDDGSVVYATGLSGMFAEYARVPKDRVYPVPAGITAAQAAALPNAVLGAAAALRYRTSMIAGAVVLVNGATGFTGRLAVRAAKLYGASRVLVTGRNAEALEDLRTIGADVLLPLTLSDEEFQTMLAEEHQKNPIDIVLDYTWGHPVELLLKVLQGSSDHARRVEVVTIGQMAGTHISLASATLRSTAIDIRGSGYGSLSSAQIHETLRILFPQFCEEVSSGRLPLKLIEAPLDRLPELWTAPVPSSERIVFTMM